jgi:hypothetical protein
LAQTSRELIRAQASLIEPLQVRPGCPGRKEIGFPLPGLLICDPISDVLRVRILHRVILDPSTLSTTLDLAYPGCLFAHGYTVGLRKDTYVNGISNFKEHRAKQKTTNGPSTQWVKLISEAMSALVFEVGC